MFDILESDIVVMQELKIQRKDLRDDMVLVDGWDCYFSLPKHKKGYSGVGIYTRNTTCAPIRAEEGLLGVLPSASGVPYCELPEDESIGGYPSALQVAELGVDPALLDAEGRCVVVEFPAFVLFGVYSPANSNGMRDDFRYGFICALDCRIRNLIRAGKRVVLVGDLNVSRDELDTASSAEDMRKAGVTHEDYISTPNRRIFNQLLIGGEVAGERDEGREEGKLWDTTRAFHPDRKGMYTHWEQKINARPGNFGSRIDFVLVCEDMRLWVKDANIQEGLLGSDHCPVFADFSDVVSYAGQDVELIDKMNPPGVFDNGVRQRDWKVQDVPAFSGKRLPEFDKRRSIKSMFAAPASMKLQTLAPNLSTDSALISEAPLSSANTSNDAQPTKSTNAISEATTSSNDIKVSPPLKRKVSSPVKTMASKRQKPSEPSKLKGQQSLKGFFQKSTTNGTKGPTPEVADTLEDVMESKRPSTPQGATAVRQLSPVKPQTPADGEHYVEQRTPTAYTASPASTMDASPSSITAKFAAVEENQKSWGALFSRPVAPLCEGHSEPCKTMQTKKKGSNQGRSFWMCARPLGPSGSKEKGTQWRCPTFIWCSDWQPRKGEERAGGENG